MQWWCHWLTVARGTHLNEKKKCSEHKNNLFNCNLLFLMVFNQYLFTWEVSLFQRDKLSGHFAFLFLYFSIQVVSWRWATLQWNYVWTDQYTIIPKVTNTRMKIDWLEWGWRSRDTERGIPVLREVLFSVSSSGEKEVFVYNNNIIYTIALLSVSFHLFR